MRTLFTIKTKFSKAIPAEQGDGKRQSEIRALDTVTDSGVRGGICVSLGSRISVLYGRQDPYFFEKLSSFQGQQAVMIVVISLQGTLSLYDIHQ